MKDFALYSNQNLCEKRKAGGTETVYEYVVETRHLSKKYGNVRALEQVSVHVKQGEIYGLIGDNGAGKTTLLKTLAGHIWPSDGELRLFGEYEETKLLKCRRRIGAMIEEPGFFPNLSVKQNMEYYRILKGIPGKEKIGETLKLMEIWNRRDSKCSALSMGMKQRLGLAIAMLGEPEMLILDEPINGLDPSGIVEFRNLLLRLNKEKNVTIMLSSHILSELQQTADIFGFLHKGRMLEEIGKKELKEKCEDCLEICVSDVETYARLLDQYFSDEYYRVLPGQMVEVSNPKREVEEYSRLAAENDLLITGLRRRRQSLEEYFINLKGGVVRE